VTDQEREAEIARAKRREERLPEREREGRPPGCCNAKHPVAEFYCWLPAGHDGDFHTAGLEDWERSGGTS